ncbi:conserved hypothetical protein [Candidatus Nitrotoga fabula]|uniref:Uncharacterized protein n=2 Tax=Candidatus Nitrotoga fabula TaxID=2182327 RepID=A0A916FC74_9PROT|nr:conserved hypothetical protein [Candidatus Nitrotoga fabula]
MEEKMNPKNLKFVQVLTLVLVAVVSTVVFIVMLHDDYRLGELRTQVVTAMLGAFAVAVAYWMGSTSGSARKTELMVGKNDSNGGA